MQKNNICQSNKYKKLHVDPPCNSWTPNNLHVPPCIVLAFRISHQNPPALGYVHDYHPYSTSFIAIFDKDVLVFPPVPSRPILGSMMLRVPHLGRVLPSFVILVLLPPLVLQLLLLRLIGSFVVTLLLQLISFLWQTNDLLRRRFQFYIGND